MSNPIARLDARENEIGWVGGGGWGETAEGKGGQELSTTVAGDHVEKSFSYTATQNNQLHHRTNYSATPLHTLLRCTIA